MNATKTEVKQAVETLFKVKVTGVRTTTVEGKERRRGKFSGYRPDWKKAAGVRPERRTEDAGVSEQPVSAVQPLAISC